MTPPLRFCFALHLHQPWGNLDHVFADHLAEVYRPLVRTLIDGELWPVAMHISGPLLEWLDAHAPDFLDEIASHALAGRLEILCAGQDEPILAVLSRPDRFEQVLRSRQRIRERLGVDAPGLWLTERVWEPTLPGELTSAGVRFALVDDRHFRVTGFREDQLHTHFVTEAGGHRLNLFPIDEKLRYLIPFRPPAELAEYFRALRDAGHELAVLGDDGEKFGGWPGTRAWLYDEGWLESFLGTMRELRDRDEVRLSRFDDATTAVRSGGLAYLPSASYREMEGWSLPVEPARALLRLEQAWDAAGTAVLDGGLLRGGHWRHFLVKYPESNRMHKYGTAISAFCRERGNRTDIRRSVGRAQCNDAYWHGVFGGFYLPFLRAAVWKNLAAAEVLLRQGESLAIESRDIEMVGRDQLWIHSTLASVLVAPAQGALVTLWLDLSREENLLNVVARHREAYHEPLRHEPGNTGRANAHDATGGAPSIHDLETQLGEVPPFDTEPRGLFADRVIAAATTRDDFVAGRVVAARSWARQEMNSSWQVSDGVAELSCRCGDLAKTIRIDDTAGIISCAWEWTPAEHPGGSWFTTELSFSAPLTIVADGADRWDYEIETVAKSEKGFDRTVQGSAVVLRWPIANGAARVSVSVAQ